MAGFPLAVAALNRAGLGPLRADVSTGELRRAGLGAMGEVAARLASATPMSSSATPTAPDRCPATDEREWRARRRRAPGELGQLGLRVCLPHSTPGESPYWPGGCVLVEDSGAPVVRRLLLEIAPRRAQATPGVKHVARHSTPPRAPQVEHARGWRSMLDQGVCARVLDHELGLVPGPAAPTRTVPLPSSTAHTPPA